MSVLNGHNPENKLLQRTDPLDHQHEKINRGLLFMAEVYEDSSETYGEIFLDYECLNNERMLQGAVMHIRVHVDITAPTFVHLKFSQLPGILQVLLPGSGMFFKFIPPGMFYDGLVISGMVDFNTNSFFIVSIGAYRIGGWGVDVDGEYWDDPQDDWWVDGGYFVTQNPVEYHDQDPWVHANLTADGNIGATDIVGGQTTRTAPAPHFVTEFDAHKIDTDAHKNLTVDGDTGNPNLPF